MIPTIPGYHGDDPTDARLAVFPMVRRNSPPSAALADRDRDTKRCHHDRDAEDVEAQRPSAKGSGGPSGRAGIRRGPGGQRSGY